MLLRCRCYQSNLQIECRACPKRNSISCMPQLPMESQGTPNSQKNLEKNKTGGLPLPDFKIYHNVCIKTDKLME